MPRLFNRNVLISEGPVFEAVLADMMVLHLTVPVITTA